MNINMHKLCYKQISREEIEVFFSNFYCVYIYIYIYGFSIQNKYSFTQAQTGDFFKKKVYENSNTVNIDGAVSRVNMFWISEVRLDKSPFRMEQDISIWNGRKQIKIRTENSE